MNIMNTEKLTTLLHYKGEINGPIITELLDDLDFKCINHDVSDIKRKKIFNIAVEMFQNLYHYTRDLSLEGISDHEARMIELSFDIDENDYLLKTSNLLKSEHEKDLRERIDKVNRMDAKELRNYYREVLNNEEFSDKGGAGLGFIDMKKRSGEPLDYEIEITDQNIKKYTLVVKVGK